MSKTETVHTRVAPETKEKADAIFASLGLTTSQAISLFLNASVNRNGFPFELVLPSKEDEDLEFASAIASVDGVPPYFFPFFHGIDCAHPAARIAKAKRSAAPTDCAPWSKGLASFISAISASQKPE